MKSYIDVPSEGFNRLCKIIQKSIFSGICRLCNWWLHENLRLKDCRSIVWNSASLSLMQRAAWTRGLRLVQSCWTMTAVSQACLKSRVGLDCPVLWGDYHPHSLAQQSKRLSFCVLKHPHPTCRPSDRLISHLEYRDLSLEVAAL